MTQNINHSSFCSLQMDIQITGYNLNVKCTDFKHETRTESNFQISEYGRHQDGKRETFSF